MRHTLLISLLIMPMAALSQDQGGVIRGTITGPQGERIPYLWVRAKNADDGNEVGRSETSAKGAYRIDGLDQGEYLVEVSTPCCAYKWHESAPVSVEGDKAVVLDVALEEGASFNTVGDDPGNLAAMVRSETVIPDKPLPQLTSGKPDFSGMWLIGLDPFPEEPEALDWAQEVYDERIANAGRDHPHTDCLPGDPPIAVSTPPFFAKFVHKDELLVQLREDYPGFRQFRRTLGGRRPCRGNDRLQRPWLALGLAALGGITDHRTLYAT
jgi:hypothetical protein